MDIAAGDFYLANGGVIGQAVQNRQETFADSFNRDGDFLSFMHKPSCGKINGLVGKGIHTARAG